MPRPAASLLRSPRWNCSTRSQLRAGRALLIEATLDSPDQVLYAQERKAKNELSAQLRADGVDYTERMNELDKVTYPQPGQAFIDQAYTTTGSRMMGLHVLNRAPSQSCVT